MANLQVNDAATFEAIVADPPRLTRAGEFRAERIAGEATVGGETLTFTYFSQPGDRFGGRFPEFRGSIDHLEVTRADGSLVYTITDITGVGLADLIDVSVAGGPGIDALIYGGEDQYTASAGNDVIDAGFVADVVGTQGITIDGGDGNDTVVLPGRLTDYTIVAGSFAAPEGLVLDGPIGRITLTGIESVTPSQTTPMAGISVAPTGPVSESDEDTLTFTVALDMPLADGDPVRLQVTPSYDGAGDPQVDLTNAGNRTNNPDIVRDAIAAAAAGRDGVSFDPETGILTLAAPARTFAFDVTIQDDMQAEGIETLRVSIAAAGDDANVEIGDTSAAVAIADPDADVTFSVTAAPAEIIESPDESATFTLDLDGAPIPEGNTASVTVMRGGETTDDDFAQAPLAAFADAVSNEAGASFAGNTLTVTSAFDGQLTWRVTPVADDRIEFSDPLTFTLSDAAITDGTAAIAEASALVNVADAPALAPEAAFTISVTPTRIDEEDQESATFTLRLDVPLQDGPPLRDDNTADVTLTFAGNSEPRDLQTPAGDVLDAAAAGEPGVSRDGDVLRFDQAFDGVLSWSVTARDDRRDEGVETLRARLSDPGIAQGTVTLETRRADLDIRDDDRPPPPPPPENLAPTPLADSFTVTEDGTRFIAKADLLANDSDPDGDAITFADVDLTGLAGDLQAADDGFIYDPRNAFQSLAQDQTATDTFRYSISDGDATASAPVTMTVTGENDAPEALDDRFATDENSTVTGNLLADNGSGADSDVDAGDSFTVTGVDGFSGGVGSGITLASGAVVSVESDGTFTYDPDGAFDGLDDGETGKDSFTYTITDASGLSDTATATVDIDGRVETTIGVAVSPENLTEEEQTDPNGARFRLNLDQQIDSGSATIELKVEGTATAAAETSKDDYAGNIPTTVTLTSEDGFGRNFDITILDQPRFGDNPDDPEPDETITVSIVSASLAGGIAIDPAQQTATLTIEELDTKIDETAANAGVDIPASGSGPLDGDDFIVGSAFADHIDADMGNDDVFGGGGDDTIAGGEGEDVIDAGPGNDEVRGDPLEGRDDGSDDAYDGGSGIDTLRYRFTIEPLTADLDPTEGDGTVTGAEIGTDTIRNFERFESGQGNDVITGGPNITYINGFEGDDTISGGSGGQVIVGAPGSDVIDAGAGNDTISAFFDDDDDVFDGGSGAFDRLVYSIGTDVPLTIDMRDAGGSGGTVTGDGLGTDVFRNIETVEGGDANDIFLLDPSVPRVEGGDGNDQFRLGEVAIRAFDVVDITDFDAAGDDVIGIDVFADGGGAAGFPDAFADGVRIHTANGGLASVTMSDTPLTANQIFGTFANPSSFASSIRTGIGGFTSGLVFGLSNDGSALWLAEVTTDAAIADIFTAARAPNGNLDTADDIILV